MSSTFFHKPELALRRAYELQGIHQSEAALTLLHDVLSSRRHRTWSPAFEQIMIAYLDLCLKLHRAREAKDGLHQYRNLAQAQAPGSLEKVIRYLLEKAEDQCSRAKAAADAAALAASETSTPLSILDDDDDGEVGESGIGPQAILLSSMSTDPAKNQRDSLMLLPSLKFLWEIYRAVLDILRSNSKLEHVYHATAVSGFQFCRVYSRRTEFRRLCDLLRMHLGNLQKYGDDIAAKPNNKVRTILSLQPVNRYSGIVQRCLTS
jgi:translation initiation factor 3 subunit A